MDEIHKKFNSLKKNISQYGRVIVAFSGGVDSSLLLKAASDILGQGVFAVTAKSPAYAKSEIESAKLLAKLIGVKHILVDSNHLNIEAFKNNPPDRCYHCKKELAKLLKEIAEKESAKVIFDGTNFDDIKDYRPGRKAACEEGIQSPLADAQLTKSEIRILSKELGLSIWDKPAQACLSSRVPYGNEINITRLGMIESAETVLLNLGIQQGRVRCYDDTARIEVGKEERKRFFSEKFMDKISEELKNIGFKYITLDLEGYRTGSMNQVLDLGIIKED